MGHMLRFGVPSTSDFVFVRDTYIAKVTDNGSGTSSLQCSGEDGHSFPFIVTGDAATIVDDLGAGNFINITPYGASTPIVWLRINKIMYFFPAYDETSNRGVSGTTRIYGDDWGHLDVTDSLATIAAAIGTYTVI
jgi:hypothetical protein